MPRTWSRLVAIRRRAARSLDRDHEDQIMLERLRLSSGRIVRREVDEFAVLTVTVNDGIEVYFQKRRRTWLESGRPHRRLRADSRRFHLIDDQRSHLVVPQWNAKRNQGAEWIGALQAERLERRESQVRPSFRRHCRQLADGADVDGRARRGRTRRDVARWRAGDREPHKDKREQEWLSSQLSPRHAQHAESLAGAGVIAVAFARKRWGSKRDELARIPRSGNDCAAAASTGGRIPTAASDSPARL